MTATPSSVAGNADASMREPLVPVEVLATPLPLAQAAPVGAPSLPSPAAAQEQGGAYLQLAAFSTPANAETLAARVRSELAMFADRLQLLDEGGRYRLQLGPFASVDDARIEADRIGAMLDLQPFVVLR